MKLLALLLLATLPIWSIPFAAACDSKDHKGAAVLPYAVGSDGITRVLLAQTSSGWSSLGGYPKKVVSVNFPNPHCETSQETAIREAVEESRYLLSHELLLDRVKGSPYFPRKPNRNEFVTFVIRIDNLDLGPYYTTTVLPKLGHTETNAIGWVELQELVDKASDDTVTVRTPNGGPLRPVFWKSLQLELNAKGAALFPN